MEMILGDRRATRRYPVRLQLHYRLLRGSRILYEGRGTTNNISRGGVEFETGRFLPSGLSIQMWIAWPVLMRGCEQMLLRLVGRTVRCDGDRAAVRTSWHEFVRAETPAAHDSERQPVMVA